MISNRFYFSVLAACLVVYCLGAAMIPLMDIDASQYASISREMLERNNFLQIFDQGQDYLDKPPLLFWLSALSMKVFGIYDWAYRIPSILVLMAGLYATGKLARIFYNEDIARISVMVLASSQALFLISHDIRTDTMLMGWVILSIWQLAEWFRTQQWRNFIGAFVFIACGMMTKGPVALMVPGLAFAAHFLAQRNWKQFYRWEYLLGILIIGILLLPMCMGLYQQYDLQPGKLINGRPIESGLKFYFWTQSFGRYTGENFYKEMGHFSFLLENMFWSFLPWIFIFLLALLSAAWKIMLQRFKISEQEELITFSGFVLTYLVLARSQAQLPHYIFVVYPLAAIITARFLYDILVLNKYPKWVKPMLFWHGFIFSVLWIAAGMIVLLVFPGQPFVFILLLVNGVCLFVLSYKRITVKRPQFLLPFFITGIGVNLLLSTAFYPKLLQFQMGNDAAAFIENNQIKKSELKLYGIHNSNALHFYSNHIFPFKQSKADFLASDKVLTSKDSLSKFMPLFPEAKVIHEGNQFAVSLLTLPFLNPATREKETPKYIIIDLDGKP